jgi:hypothetical protein
MSHRFIKFSINEGSSLEVPLYCLCGTQRYDLLLRFWNFRLWDRVSLFLGNNSAFTSAV